MQASSSEMSRAPKFFSRCRLRRLIYRVAAPAAWADRVDGAQWDADQPLPWIGTPNISTHTRLVGDLFAQAIVAAAERVGSGGRRKRDHQSGRVGLGVGLIRDDVARRLERTGDVVIWTRAAIDTALWFVCSAGRANEPIIAALLDIVRKTWKLDVRPSMKRWRLRCLRSDQRGGAPKSAPCLSEHFGRPAAAQSLVQIDQRRLPVAQRIHARTSRIEEVALIVEHVDEARIPALVSQIRQPQRFDQLRTAIVLRDEDLARTAMRDQRIVRVTKRRPHRLHIADLRLLRRAVAASTCAPMRAAPEDRLQQVAGD